MAPLFQLSVRKKSCSGMKCPGFQLKAYKYMQTQIVCHHVKFPSQLSEQPSLLKSEFILFPCYFKSIGIYLKIVSRKVLVQKTGLIYIIAYKDMHVCVHLSIASLYKSYLSTNVASLAYNSMSLSGVGVFWYVKTQFEWLFFFQECLTFCRLLPSTPVVSSL